ncbi:MAG: glycoside hydrolase family 88 protein [Lachnospiraceae bacterium]|nr:glycoside hydrolase family 88 protein [Lachnospiraceae bacterium]
MEEIRDRRKSGDFAPFTKEDPLYAKSKEKLRLVTDAFTEILYARDDLFMDNMKEHNLAGDDISRYLNWEWPQGVGLYGIWKLYLERKDVGCLDLLKKYYDRQIAIGFPALNVNTTAPYLAMSFLAEETGEEKYLAPCVEAAKEIMTSFARTEAGGIQHLTSDSVNEQELWDDTLYMLVLFLANMGRILKDEDMSHEAEYQFLLHEKYLCDKTTGLWYHGWTFKGHHNFAGAFWGRGNCWITMAIPEYLSIGGCSEAGKKLLVNALRDQIRTLLELQAEDGMWHTLVDDESSYEEMSATCGFAYGMLKAVADGLIEEEYRDQVLCAVRNALPSVLAGISDTGVVGQVSGGTAMGRDSKEFYKTIEIIPTPYGQSLAILFLMGCLRGL